MTHDDKGRIREQFEKWAKNNCWPEKAFETNGQGEYSHSLLQGRWVAWQAALATVSTAQPVETTQAHYANDSHEKLAADMREAANAAVTNGQPSIACFVRQWADRVNYLSRQAAQPVAPNDHSFSIDLVERVRKACTRMGIATSESLEECSFKLDALIYSLCSAIDRHYEFITSREVSTAPSEAEIRNRALEEAAKVADSNTYGPCGEYDYSYTDESAAADSRAETIAKEIRALQTAAPQDKESGK